MNAPGRFEGNHDPALAEELWQMTLDGMHSHEAGSVDGIGWFAYVWKGSHSYVIRQDSQGFVDIVWQHVSALDWRELAAEADAAAYPEDGS